MEIMLRVEKICAHGQFKELYCNTITVNDGLQAPFQKLLDGLSLLYPDCTYHFAILHFNQNI